MQLEQLLVRCSPCRLPHCLPVLLEFANRNKNVFIDTSVHIHSDVRLDNDAQRDKLLNFLPKSSVNSAKASLKLMLIYSSFDNATHSVLFFMILLSQRKNVKSYFWYSTYVLQYIHMYVLSDGFFYT